MDLTTARDFVRQFAREAGSSLMFADAMIDRAIIAVCSWVTHQLRYPKVSTQISIAATNSGTVDVSGLTAANWLPHHTIDVTISTTNSAGSLSRIEWSDYWNLKNTADETGVPDRISFVDLGNTAYIYPKPDTNYTGYVRWFQPFISFQPGIQGTWSSSTTYTGGDVVSYSTNGAYVSKVNQNAAVNPTNTASWRNVSTSTNTATFDPLQISLNLPDDWLTQILSTGVPARLMANVPEHAALAQKLEMDFQRYVNDLRDAASFGARKAERGMMR